VVGLMRSNDPDSYTGSNSAGGRVSNAGQVKGDERSQERDNLVHQLWSWGIRPITSPL
jgi:hypothetical protein